MSQFDLTGKVAIVTGSSRGIGKASALALAEHGAKVVISSRKQEACNAVADEINGRFGEGAAIAVAANISDKDALQHLVDETRRAFGRIDILVCNAASNPYYGPLAGISDDQFRKILDNNILSNHWLIQMVAPEMRERGEGSIIIISSIGGLRGSPVIGGYNVSKAGVKVATEALAHELRNIAGVKITAHLLIPGFVWTHLTKAGRTEKPSGAWTPEQTVDFMLTSLDRGDFYILCPDNEVDRATDEKRILWAAGDVVENRPPLSRWHKDFGDKFKAYLKG